MSSGSTIEINGKRYDTQTGKAHPGTGEAVAMSARPAPVVRNMDGIVKSKRVSSGMSHARHKIAKSKTLMRHAVKKPLEAKPHINTRTSPVSKPVQAHPTPSMSGFFRSAPDAHRTDRAKTVNRSNLVSKFSDFTSNTYQSVQTAVRPTPVVQAPQTAEPQHRATAAPAQRPADRMVERAMANATSHEEQMEKKPKLRAKTARKFGTSTKVVSVSAISLVVVLLGAFFAYQNVPNFAMRVAAARSGVKANLPGYKPSGFAMSGRVEYGAGQVTISYGANGDDRHYSVTQKNSSWNSDALQANNTTTKGAPSNTIQVNGSTVYIYPDSSAMWVNGGVLYEIAGDAGLNSEQLMRIASSM